MQPIQHSRMPLRKGTGMATLYCSFFNGGITRGKEGWSLCKVASVRVGVPGVPCSTMHGGYVFCTSVKAAMISLMSLSVQANIYFQRPPLSPTAISRFPQLKTANNIRLKHRNSVQRNCWPALRPAELAKWVHSGKIVTKRNAFGRRLLCCKSAVVLVGGILKIRKFILPSLAS